MVSKEWQSAVKCKAVHTILMANPKISGMQACMSNRVKGVIGTAIQACGAVHGEKQRQTHASYTQYAFLVIVTSMNIYGLAVD